MATMPQTDKAEDEVEVVKVVTRDIMTKDPTVAIMTSEEVTALDQDKTGKKAKNVWLNIGR